eukprot:scpid69782/ scgid27411/ SET domain-containing protein 4
MGHGRARRRRNRQRISCGKRAVPVTSRCCVRFLQWSHSVGAGMSQLLRPAMFPGTGRGMMATRRIEPGECIASVPRQRLVTCADVKLQLEVEIHQDTMDKSSNAAGLDDVSILAVFILVERSKGSTSQWSHYLDVLPDAYELPVCFAADELALLPLSLLERVRTQRSHLVEQHERASKLLTTLVPDLQYERFLNAWCAVNTRTVYLSESSTGNPATDDGDTSAGNCALAPYLDFLNHSPGARVTAGYNSSTRRYEIVTQDRYRHGDEVFICYGPHDNQRLLLEYGFVLDDNPHCSVMLGLLQLIPLAAGEHAFVAALWCDRRRSQILVEAELDTVNPTADGCGWKLLAALDILVLDAAELDSWHAYVYGGRTLADVARRELKGRVGVCLCAAARCHLLPSREKLNGIVRCDGSSANARTAATLSLQQHAILDAAQAELNALSTDAAVG